MANEPIRILIVEDSSRDAELAQREIRRSLGPCVFRNVETREDYLTALETFQPDLILSDYSLPRFDGMTALKLALERVPLTPVVVWTGSLNEDIAVECMKAGATNYIIKENIKRLGPAVVHALAEKQVGVERKRAEEALRDSEARYRLLAENASDVIFAMDMNLHFTYISPSVTRLRGYTVEEAMAQTVVEILTPASLELVANAFQEALAIEDRAYQNSPPSRTLELEEYCKDGSTVWVEITFTFLRDAQDQMIGFLGITRDITERKRAEEQIQKNAARAEALARVAARLNAQLDMNAVLGAVCEETARALNVPGATVTLYDEHEQVLYYAADFGMPAEYLARAQPVPRAFFDRYLLEERTVLVIPDIQARREFPNTPLFTDLNIHTVVSGAMQRDSELIGSLNIYSFGEIRQFADDELALLKGLADQAALAIANARLYEQERASRTELDALFAVSSRLREAQGADNVAKLALRQTMEIFHADAGTLTLKQLNSDQFKIAFAEGHIASAVGHTHGTEGTIGGIVLHTRRPYVTLDYASDPRRLVLEATEHIGPAAFVPLQSEIEFLGVMMIARPRTPDAKPFSPAEVRLLATIGEMVGNTLRRARLYDDAQRRLERTQALHQIDITITSSFDLRFTIGVFLEQATTQLHVDAAEVLLYDPHSHILEYVAGRGFRSSATSQTRLRLGEGYAGRAALERRIITASHWDKDTNGLARTTWLGGEDFVDYFAVPLIAKGDIKGVLEIFHRAPIEANAEWLEFLNTLATQAAVAIDNATLFNNLQRSNIELALAYDETIHGWSRALDLRDRETQGHTERVMELTLRLARAMNIPQEDMVHIRRGALLHDIGKMGVPDSILLKSTKLSDDEWQIMRSHPESAFQMLATIPYLKPALDIPYCHHEKWDGTGYPRGLKGEQIPLVARIFAVVDVWDALCSDRPYRHAWSEEAALNYIREQAGKHFDPKVAAIFLQLISNGEI
ncbi:MAG: GAF domain-containing protein [Chloroflexi bacterium]|nr:GAF domain-containing protein [Chloroflexota bacterium]